MWALLCHKCLGKGHTHNGEVCDECNGSKEIPQARCPNSTLTELGLSAFQAYAFFKNYQILPQKGGMLDQSAYFLKVVRFCESVTSSLEELRDEKNEQLRRLAERTRKGSNNNGR